MKKAFQQFEENFTAIKEMERLYSEIKESDLPYDLSDILRAQYVYAVSALDKLIHDLVRIGMLQAFINKRIRTKKFDNFSISLETYNKIQRSQSDNLALETPENIFERVIIDKHKKDSFQDPEKVADALSFIWAEDDKWQKIFSDFNNSANNRSVFNISENKNLRDKLKNIVSRRNQIVHEADIDIQTHCRAPIDEENVKETVKFISTLGETIFNCVNLKQN